MGNYEQLKEAISNSIKANGNQEITGDVMQSALLNIISNIGANATFAGIATPRTAPGTPDQNVFYIASEDGTYSNFGGIVVSGEVVILQNSEGGWQKKSTGIAAVDMDKYFRTEVDSEEKLTKAGDAGDASWLETRWDETTFDGKKEAVSRRQMKLGKSAIGVTTDGRAYVEKEGNCKILLTVENLADYANLPTRIVDMGEYSSSEGFYFNEPLLAELAAAINAVSEGKASLLLKATTSNRVPLAFTGASVRIEDGVDYRLTFLFDDGRSYSISFEAGYPDSVQQGFTEGGGSGTITSKAYTDNKDYKEI